MRPLILVGSKFTPILTAYLKENKFSLEEKASSIAYTICYTHIKYSIKICQAYQELGWNDWKTKKDKQLTVSKDIIHILEMTKWTIWCENGAFEKRFEWKFWNWKYNDGNEKCNKWTWQYIKPKVSRKKEIVKKSKNINEMQNKNKKIELI